VPLVLDLVPPLISHIATRSRGRLGEEWVSYQNYSIPILYTLQP
jgi:hypothetical protein